jgi:hypothetical protein
VKSIKDGKWKMQNGDYCVIDRTGEVGKIQQFYIGVISKEVILRILKYKKAGGINCYEILECTNYDVLISWNETFPAKIVCFENKIVYNIWW